MAHDHDGLVRMRGDDRVERVDHARLHRAQRLAAREHRARRRGLHDLPLVGLREVDDLAAGPVAVVGLDHAGQWLHFESEPRGDVAPRSASSVRSGSRTRWRSSAPPGGRPRPRPGSMPFSERSMPGMRPDSSGPVCAVTPWRTRTSRVGGFASCFSACVPVGRGVGRGSGRGFGRGIRSRLRHGPSLPARSCRLGRRVRGRRRGPISITAS